jgi:hypothetical protein
MGGFPDEDEAPYWLADPDADGEGDDLDLSQLKPRPRSRNLDDAPITEMTRPLIAPLFRATNAIARLEAAVSCAPPAVIEGIGARIAYREAAGWLGHVSAWVHPTDLALKHLGLTGNYVAAGRTGQLKAHMPTTAAAGGPLDRPEPLSAEWRIASALSLARQWRRLGEFRTWRPLQNPHSLREALTALDPAAASFEDQELVAWLAGLSATPDTADLLTAAWAARDWMNARLDAGPLTAPGIFLAACVWRERGYGRSISLPFWSATGYRLQRLSSAVGVPWLIGFLDCVAEAAQDARQRLESLKRSHQKAAALACGARSHLPEAIEAAIRAPVITARTLARQLTITRQAALVLLKQLVDAGIVREATGRAAWRAFVTA